jgi:lysophospholipase L1-like esterase
MKAIRQRFAATWLGLIATMVLAGPAPARAADGHWVSAWGTAQQLAPNPPPPFAPPKPGAKPAVPPPPPGPSPIPPTPASLADQTVRMVVRPTIGGRVVRVQFSNAAGGGPVTFGAAHVAKSAAGGAVRAGTDRVLTFGGEPAVTIQPGAVAISDPVSLDVAPFELLSVSVHVPGVTPVNTVHPLGLRTTYIAAGNRVADAALAGASTNRSYFWLSGVEVEADAAAGAVVAFGDSITDGFATTADAGRAWPDLLAERLKDAPGPRRSVVNMGISGNRLRRDGAGLAALARFDRDVLARPGVRWVILLEGINDINVAAFPNVPASEAVTAGQLIAAYRQFIARAHLHGIRVMGATITPTEGLWLYKPAGEAIRQEVNRWIRSSRAFDAVVDFDAAVRDPARPTRLNPAYDPGDHVHPNDAGNAAMARAVDLAVLTR